MNAQDKVANIIGQMTLRVIELETQVEALREENKKLTNEMYPEKLKDAPN